MSYQLLQRVEQFAKKHFWIVHALFVVVAAILSARAANQVIVGQLVNKLSGGAVDGAQADKSYKREKRVMRDFGAAADKNIFDGKRQVIKKNGKVEIACEENADCPAGQKCRPKEATVDAKKEDKEKVSKICQVAQGEDADYANAVESEANIKLIGSSVYSNPYDSYATIADYDNNKAVDLYSLYECDEDATKSEDEDSEEDEKEPGEKESDDYDPSVYQASPFPCRDLPGGHTLLRIDVDRVYFQNNEEGQTEYILLDDQRELNSRKSKRKKTAKKKDDKKKDKDDDVGKGIRKTGSTSWEIEQGELDGALGNMAKLATQARVVPAFEGGKAIGFKLFSIRRNSLYEKIGLKNGDIIKSINGYDMSDPANAMQLIGKLKDGKSFQVDIKRRGKNTTLDYSVVK